VARIDSDSGHTAVGAGYGAGIVADNDAAEGELSQISLARRQSQSDKRQRYFLKGPLSFGWVCNNIPDPTSRLVLVARAFMDMAGSEECVLTAKVWHCAGIANRDQRRRVLARLRKLDGNFEVVDRKGRPSVLRKAVRAIVEK